MQFLTFAAGLLAGMTVVNAQATTPVFSCDASDKALCCQSNTNQNHCTYAATFLGQNTCAINNLPANAYCCATATKAKKHHKKHHHKKHGGGKDEQAEEDDLEARANGSGNKWKGKGCVAAVLS